MNKKSQMLNAVESIRIYKGEKKTGKLKILKSLEDIT